MKTIFRPNRNRASAWRAALLALLVCALVPSVPAQAPPPSAYDQQNDADRLSPEDLADLLGPIALYPDALIALILPASTVASDVVLAARYLADGGNPDDVSGQPWDESVKGLAHYPDVLKWMDENLEWTNSLGEAFVEQPADVMNAIQQLRGRARNTGKLVNTPQQTVVVEKESIRIVPADPEIIYVPQYDPEVVYVERETVDYGPVLTFTAGFAVGSWLNYDFDWGRRQFYHGNGCGWNNRDRWNDRGHRSDDNSINIVNTNTNTNITNVTNVVNNNYGSGSQWQASAKSRRNFEERRRKNLGNARIARANSQAARLASRDANAANAQKRAQRVPKPAQLNTGQSANAGKNRDRQKVSAASLSGTPAGAQQAARNAQMRDGANAQKAGNNKHGNGKGKNKQPSAAPLVAGESSKARAKGAASHPGNNGGRKGDGPGKGKKHQPSPAPAVASVDSASTPKKQSSGGGGGGGGGNKARGTGGGGGNKAQGGGGGGNGANRKQSARDDSPKQSGAARKAQNQDIRRNQNPAPSQPVVSKPARQAPQANPERQRQARVEQPQRQAPRPASSNNGAGNRAQKGGGGGGGGGNKAQGGGGGNKAQGGGGANQNKGDAQKGSGGKKKDKKKDQS